MNETFSRIKSMVKMDEVAEKYGFKLNRQHHVHCPFHDDQSPSLIIYPGERGWWCFVCNEGGSVIDFVAKLYHLSVREAAQKLNDDFRLGIMNGQPPSLMAIQRQNHERLMKDRKKELADADYLIHIWRSRELRAAPQPEDKPHDDPSWGQYAALMGELDYLDNYYFDRGRSS